MLDRAAVRLGSGTCGAGRWRDRRLPASTGVAADISACAGCPALGPSFAARLGSFRRRRRLTLRLRLGTVTSVGASIGGVCGSGSVIGLGSSGATSGTVGSSQLGRGRRREHQGDRLCRRLGRQQRVAGGQDNDRHTCMPRSDQRPAGSRLTLLPPHTSEPNSGRAHRTPFR